MPSGENTICVRTVTQTWGCASAAREARHSSQRAGQGGRSAELVRLPHSAINLPGSLFETSIRAARPLPAKSGANVAAHGLGFL